ncbi:MAG: hypothetical protein FWF23_00430 [Alphaproteobacteria bacterium]|nr:hypothetical protein [Alphaproteobacteria bacterium]MCL2505077.1 hypothetical protein [Alphaproteobacteria bacterium]
MSSIDEEQIEPRMPQKVSDRVIKIIDGRKYVATKTVTVDGKDYQEFCSVEATRTHTVYAENIDGNYEEVTDLATINAIRQKYVNKNLLKGIIVLDDMWDEESVAWQKKVGAEFDEGQRLREEQRLKDKKQIDEDFKKVYEEDRKTFPEKFVAVYGETLNINPSYGEINVREDFMKIKGYYLSEGINDHLLFAAQCWSDRIEFSTKNNINNDFFRVHEFVHAVTKDSDRTGLLCYNLDDKEEKGRALDEGATNLMTEKILGRNIYDNYPYETHLMRQLSEIVGENYIVSGMYKDPNILQTRFDKLAGVGAYTKLASDADGIYRNNELAYTLEHESAEKNIPLDQEKYDEYQQAAVKAYEQACAHMLDAVFCQPIESASSFEEAKKHAEAFREFCSKMKRHNVYSSDAKLYKEMQKKIYQTTGEKFGKAAKIEIMLNPEIKQVIEETKDRINQIVPKLKETVADFTNSVDKRVNTLADALLNANGGNSAATGSREYRALLFEAPQATGALVKAQKSPDLKHVEKKKAGIIKTPNIK